MGSKGGGGGGSGSNSFGFSSGTSTYTPNPQAMAAFQQSLGLAQNAISRPYQPYQGQMTAGFTPDQMAAMQGVRNSQGVAQPYINTATDLTRQAVDFSNPANFNQYSLNQYMNPYQQSVVDATMKQLAQTQAQAMKQANSQAANRGTFGGSGQYLGLAEVARQQGLSNAQTLAQLNASNYQQAQNQYNQQQQQAIQTAQNAAYGLGQLGNMAQSSALTGINALLQSGGMQQQLAQQQLTGAYNQFLQSLAYPYQQAAFYSGIASGIGPSMGGTTTYSGINMGQQQQSGGGGGGGGGAGGISSAMSMLPALFGMSEDDEKTDKKKLGKDERTGLDMYAYRYKGDPKSYPKVVGPMASEIEEKYPGFVFDVAGKRAVADLGSFMPRDERADGGASTGYSSTGSSGTSGSTASNGRADIYAAPSVNYSSSTPMPGSAQAMSSEAMDPGTAQFLKGFLDPQTADQIARSKWVSKGTKTQTANPEDSFGYFSQLTRHAADGGRIEYARGGGGGFGELPAQVIQNPLSGSPQVGANFLNQKPSAGSLGDMNTNTKLMFGANPIDSAQGSFALGLQSPSSLATSNLGAEAMKTAKAGLPAKAASTEHFSKQGADMAKSQAADAAKSGGKGGGGSGGGGGGMPKMPSMKGEGNKGNVDKVAGGNQRSIPTENSPQEQTQTPEQQKQEAQPTPETQDAKIPETAPQDVVGGDAATGAGGGEGFGGMEGGAPEMAAAPAPEAPAPEAPAADAGGGMGTDWLTGLGGFGGLFAKGGRIHKAGGGAGGAGAGGPGGFGAMGDGPVDIAPSGLAEAAGMGPSPLLGRPDAGLGQLTSGFGNKPSDLAGFGKLKAGQEQRTGSDLTKGWMQQYRDEYTGGPQKTPKEQGMPDMPDAEYYKTPLNVSDVSIGSNGTPNPGGISYTPIMTGMKGSGMGLFPTFTPPTNGSDYNDTSKMFKAPPTNGKVQGYYTGIGSQQVNPDTGLFNVDYLAPYHGGFFKDGGRVSKAGGGSRGMSYGPPQPYDLTPKDLRAIAQTMHFEAQDQGDKGMLGVGHVMRNRFESGKYGATPYDVVTAKNSKGVAQFTPWGSTGAGSGKNVANYNPTQREMGLAQQAFTEQQDPTNNATHYYNSKISHPAWGKSLENPVQIGAHRFGTTAGGHAGGERMMARVPENLMPDTGTRYASVTPAAQTPATPPQPSTPTPTQWQPPAEIADKVAAQNAVAGDMREPAGETTPSQNMPAATTPSMDNVPEIGGGNMDMAAAPEPEAPQMEMAGGEENTPDMGGMEMAANGGRIHKRRGGDMSSGFYNSIYNALLASAIRHGAPYPEALAKVGAAQASLETANGRHAPQNNYFGIKGPGGSYATTEVVNGKPVITRASFRGYPTMQHSADDFVRLMASSPRYKNVFNASTAEQGIAAQARTGYATDPRYGSKLAQINSTHGGGEVPSQFVSNQPRVGSSFVSNASYSPVAYNSGENRMGIIPRIINELSDAQRAELSPTGSNLNRINPADPSGPLLPPTANNSAHDTSRVADNERMIAKSPIVKKALSLSDFNPVGRAEAAENQPSTEKKSMFAWPKLSNFKTNDLPTALGMPWGLDSTSRNQNMKGPEYDSDLGDGNRNQNMKGPPMPVEQGPPMPTEQVASDNVPTPPERPKDLGTLAGDKQGQKYWGDWRDAPEYKSGFGDFIDETLAGDKRTADTAGTAATPMGKYQGEGGLGSLFDMEGSTPFAHGGTVRRGYENAGFVIDPEMLKTENSPALLKPEERQPEEETRTSGGDRPRGKVEYAQPDSESTGSKLVYPEKAKPDAMMEFYERWRTNPFSQFLWHMGQKAMQSESNNPWAALGEGASHGAMGAMEAMQLARAKYQKEAEAARNAEYARTLGYAHGGMVRKGYDEGGPIDDIVGGLGNLFGGDEVTAPRSSPRAPEMAPEGGGLFDGLLGGGEERTATPAPRAQLQEQGLFDSIGSLFGGDESPSLTPTTAKGAPQERGFLEELFGPDEETKPSPTPRAPPAERAPKIEEIVPPPISSDRVTPTPAVTPEGREPALTTAPHLGAGRFELPAEQRPIEEKRAAPSSDVPRSWHDDPIIKQAMGEIKNAPLPQDADQARIYDRFVRERQSLIKERKEEIKWEQSGTVKEITDSEGNKSLIWVGGPRNGQPFVAADQGAESKKSGPDWSKTGEDFIQTLPQQDQAYVRGMINGSIDMPKGVKQNYLVKAAAQAKPGWTPSNYQVLNQTYKEFSTTKPTQAGGQLIAGNAAIGHAGELADLVTQFGNTNYPLWNAITNKLGDESGTEKSNIRQRFESLIDKYIDEQNKFYKGSPGGVEERREAHNRYSVNKTPQQLLAALAEDQVAMASKLKPLEERFQTVQIALPPEAKKEYEAIGPKARSGQEKLNRAYEKVYGRKQDLGDEQIAPADTGPTIVRTGILDGRKVVKYSDGTTKYAD